MTPELKALELLPIGCARIASAVPDELVVDWMLVGVAFAAVLATLVVVAVVWRRA